MAILETSKPVYCTIALLHSISVCKIFQLNLNSELSKLNVINLKNKSNCIKKLYNMVLQIVMKIKLINNF